MGAIILLTMPYYEILLSNKKDSDMHGPWRQDANYKKPVTKDHKHMILFI